jgi:acyl-CoA thioesterase
MSGVAGLPAQELAGRAAGIMWSRDRACHALGIELLETGPGYAKLAMTLTENMMNFHGTAHGGYVFTLADSALSYACNSDGNAAVAAHCSITFLRPAHCGDRLIANARQIARGGRSGLYDVTVSVEEEIIAEFRGHSRMTGGSFVAPETQR